MCVCVLCFFFFSSRRRHTRFDCDWSSDVCSSDLDLAGWLMMPIALVFLSFEQALLKRLVLEAPTAAAKPDRKSTRLNSSHSQISYAVFCLKKKKIKSRV